MIDFLAIAAVLGVPANAAIVIVAFWMIDRRLIRIETACQLRCQIAGVSYSVLAAKKE